jgi:hypothetical protein
MVHGWTSSLISKIWLFARSRISTMTQNKEFVSLFCDNEDIKARFQFSKAYILEIMFHTMSFETIFV